MLGCSSDVMDMDSYIEELLWISGRSLCQQKYLSQSYHLPKADDTTGGRSTHDRSLKGPEGYIPFPSKASHIFQRKYLKQKLYHFRSHFPVNTSIVTSKFVAIPLIKEKKLCGLFWHYLMVKSVNYPHNRLPHRGSCSIWNRDMKWHVKSFVSTPVLLC